MTATVVSAPFPVLAPMHSFPPSAHLRVMRPLSTQQQLEKFLNYRLKDGLDPESNDELLAPPVRGKQFLHAPTPWRHATGASFGIG